MFKEVTCPNCGSKSWRILEFPWREPNTQGRKTFFVLRCGACQINYLSGKYLVPGEDLDPENGTFNPSKRNEGRKVEDAKRL